MARRRVQKEAEKAKEHRSALHSVAKAFDSFRPASSVLTRVRGVRTIFPQFDFATKVGGLPVERFMLMHGPSNEGKTYASLGFVQSFLMQDHFGMLVDAERTTPITWVEQIMGKLANHPGFFALRPDTYEETVSEIRKWLNTIISLRQSGDIKPDTSALIVVDSLRKLVPANILAKIMKGDKKSGVDGMGGRSAQIKAAMNAAWMDELVPLLEKAQAGCIAIAREMEDPEASMWDRKFGNAFKVGGGKAVYYDSSLVMRVERAAYIHEKDKPSADDADKSRGKVFGERHRITIRKTKVAGREDKQTVAHFHTSNGNFIPFGFDRARDVVELATSLEVIKKKGTWLTWGRHRWQGVHAAVRKLHGTPVLDELEQETRDMFQVIEPAEFDADGVVS
jgi:RecA/RadA recombinase